MVTTDETITELAERGRQTVARIRLALDSGESASIAQIVELIREVTCKFETISVQGLGEVIGRDLLTMSRVISVAHTLGFNPEGVEISTINQAIHVIGFNKIRNLALSLMLMQNASKEAVVEKRNVTATALVGGLIAQGLRTHQRSADMDEAFVCATLRHYGRIMLANFLTSDYREAVELVPEMGEDRAYRSVFGLTALELSTALLETTRMPRNVMVGLRQVTRADRAAANLPTELELPVVADFAEELTRLADDASLDSEKFSERAMALVRSYGPNVGLSEEELFELLEDVAATLKTFGALESGHALHCPLLQRLKSLASHTDPVADAAAAKARAQRSGGIQDTGDGAHQFRDPLAAGIASLIDFESQSGTGIEAAYGIALRAIHQGLSLDQTIIFRRSNRGAKSFAWLGSGDFFALIKGEELLDPKVRDVFSVCLKRGEDVLIQNPADPKISPFIPDWLRPSAGAHPLILLPVRDEAGTVTIFCGLRADSAAFALSTRQTQQLRSLRSRLANLEMHSRPADQTADAQAAA